MSLGNLFNIQSDVDLNEWPSKSDYIINIPCPETGSFIGYKIASKRKAYSDKNTVDVQIPVTLCCILELEIPEDAKRIYNVYMKCRCDKAKVIKAYDLNSYIISNQLEPYDNKDWPFYSLYDPDFEYHIGETISVEEFDGNPFHECGSGIHFFMSIKELMNYWSEN